MYLNTRNLTVILTRVVRLDDVEDDQQEAGNRLIELPVINMCQIAQSHLFGLKKIKPSGNFAVLQGVPNAKSAGL